MSYAIARLANLCILSPAYKTLTTALLYKSIVSLSCVLIPGSLSSLSTFADFVIYKVIFEFVCNFAIGADFYKGFG
jgi:hypothetical protein